MTLVKEHEKIHSKNLGVTIETVKEGDKLLYECPKCQKRYEQGGQVYVRHVAKCKGFPGTVESRRSYRYPCIDCNKNFVTKIAAAEHMYEAHQFRVENLEKFCFECKAEFEDPYIHARSHGCAYQCELVRIIFVSIDRRLYFILLPQCGLPFINQGKLDNHMKRHEQNELRPFGCDLCPLKFKSNNHLHTHKKTVHATEDEKKFPCQLCDRRYAAQYMLRTHINQAHSDVKRYNCTFCGMKFKRWDSMKVRFIC